MGSIVLNCKASSLAPIPRPAGIGSAWSWAVPVDSDMTVVDAVPLLMVNASLVEARPDAGSSPLAKTGRYSQYPHYVGVQNA